MGVIRTRGVRTQDQQQFEAARSSDASLVFVRRSVPYVGQDGVTEKDADSDFDIDLRVGSSWAKDWSEANPRYYKIPDDGIVIPAGGTVIVEVDEELRIPSNRFGLVVPKARLAFRTGVYPFTTKVDPTYAGYLKIFLHNYATHSRILKRGEAIASLVIQDTNYSVPLMRAYDGRAQADESRRRVGGLVQQYASHPLFSALAGTTVGTVIATALLVWTHVLK